MTTWKKIKDKKNYFLKVGNKENVLVFSLFVLFNNTSSLKV